MRTRSGAERDSGRDVSETGNVETEREKSAGGEKLFSGMRPEEMCQVLTPPCRQ